MEHRRISRRIQVGTVPVGGGAPIAVQSMTNTPTADVAATVRQIRRLEEAGCEIVRVAVPDREAADAIQRIKREISLPLVADIHFDARLAVRAARAGADGLRINPGNIGTPSRVREVVACARDRGIPIRIGVNAGSLEKSIVRQYHGVTAEGMVESALQHIDRIRGWDFHDLKVSLKASDVPRTVAAYRLIARKTDLPLHLGVTETGTRVGGLVKSALGIGMLLAEGIGDTLRVSLTCDPVEEVRAGWEILRALEIRRRGPEIIACPTCGRTRIDLFALVERVEREIAGIAAPLKVAVMGCVVNGPGEAREADVGIAGGDGAGILFRKGKVVRRLREEELAEALVAEVRRLAAEPPREPGRGTGGEAGL